MDARTFGNYLSRMRKAQGLTQAELAEQLHVTDKAVSRWERGIGLPDINTLEPLADALGLTLADLMHCRAPEEADAAPTIPLEDFFTMLRRQHTVDWHSVRTAHCLHDSVLSRLSLYRLAGYGVGPGVGLPDLQSCHRDLDDAGLF